MLTENLTVNEYQKKIINFTAEGEKIYHYPIM
jgi:hypothetical protein